MIKSSFFNEVVNLFSHLVVIVKDELAIIIKPIEGKVFNTYRGPLVEDLTASTVNDMGNFVGNDKFQVLRRELISKK